MTPRTENLSRLQAHLKEHTTGCADCEARHRRNITAASALAERMPLVHSTKSGWLTSILEGAALLSQAALQNKGRATTETALGTDRFVFLFAGPFRYPQYGPIGFIFSSSIEGAAAEAEASPFDTGGLGTFFDLKPAVEELRSCAFSLPSPGYRAYMGSFIGAAFDSPADYLQDGKSPACERVVLVSPVSSASADARRWTFEERIPDRLPITDGLEAIILASQAAMTPGVERLLRPIHRTGKVRVEYYSARKGGGWSEFRLLADRVLIELLEGTGR